MLFVDNDGLNKYGSAIRLGKSPIIRLCNPSLSTTRFHEKTIINVDAPCGTTCAMGIKGTGNCDDW